MEPKYEIDMHISGGNLDKDSAREAFNAILELARAYGLIVGGGYAESAYKVSKGANREKESKATKNA